MSAPAQTLLTHLLLAAAVVGVAAGGPQAPALQAFGTWTGGGRGGQVIRVTSLASEGAGSLRAALAERGARIVVFEVGGVIDLGKENLTVSEPFLTLAGETAPAPGITLVRGGMKIRTHDVIVRHVRVRPGDAGEAKRSGWEPDGIGVTGYDVWIDHCSLSWAVDENASVGGPRDAGPDDASHDVTFSNCIIAEGLHDASHSKGAHSKGSLIMDGAWNIAIVGNLYAHNHRRNPLFKGGTSGVVVNNLVYAPGQSVVQLTDTGHGKVLGKPRVSAVGNVFLAGRDTRRGLSLLGGKGQVYADDNVALDPAGRALGLASEGVRLVETRTIWPEGMTALASGKLEEHVMRHAGARPAERDAVDRRILAQLRERTGRIINSQEQVGGYPKSEPTRRPLSVPESGVDAWLAGFAAAVE